MKNSSEHRAQQGAAPSAPLRPHLRRRQLGQIDRRKLLTLVLVAALLAGIAEAWHTWEALPERYNLIRSWLLANSGMSASMIFAVSVTGMFLLTWAYAHVLAALVFHKKWFQLFLVAAFTLIPGAYVFDKMNEQVCFNRAGEPLCDLVLTDQHQYRQWRTSGSLPPLGWQVVGTLSRADESLIGPAPQELPLARCSSVEFFPGGAPAIYVSRRSDGFHLWNRDGFDHFTKARLRPVQQSELPQLCAQLDRRVNEQEAQMQATAEAERRRAEEEAAAQAAAAQAEQERRQREALEQANAADFAAARVAAGSNNLLVARQHIDAIQARYPGDAEATQLSANWQLESVCADCGRVMAIGETTVKQAQSSYPALFAGAAGAAAGRGMGSEQMRDENAAKGALIGIVLGSLIASANSSKRVFIVSVQMDDGRVEHVPAFAKPTLAVGDRVVRTRFADQLQLSRQGEPAAPVN